MKNAKNTKQQAPVMTLADAFESIKAVGRGCPIPAWAGKKVYMGKQAKADWDAHAESEPKAALVTTKGSAVEE